NANSVMHAVATPIFTAPGERIVPVREATLRLTRQQHAAPNTATNIKPINSVSGGVNPNCKRGGNAGSNCTAPTPPTNTSKQIRPIATTASFNKWNQRSERKE